MLDAAYPDGTLYRVKIFRDKSLSDHTRHRRAVKKLSRECAAIEWMSTSPACAGFVPKVLIRHDGEPGSSDRAPFLVTPYPPGVRLHGHFGGLSEQRKVRPLLRTRRADVRTRRCPLPTARSPYHNT